MRFVGFVAHTAIQEASVRDGSLGAQNEAKYAEEPIPAPSGN